MVIVVGNDRSLQFCKDCCWNCVVVVVIGSSMVGVVDSTVSEPTTGVGDSVGGSTDTLEYREEVA